MRYPHGSRYCASGSNAGRCSTGAQINLTFVFIAAAVTKDTVQLEERSRSRVISVLMLITCLPSALVCVRPRAAWVPLLSGLSSGLISTALLHPLDVAKTSLINPDKRSSGMLALFREIRSQNGWTGMWRGVVPALARISVVSSTSALTRMLTRLRATSAAIARDCRSCTALCVLLRIYDQQGSSIYFTTQTQLLSIIRQRMHEQGQAAIESDGLGPSWAHVAWPDSDKPHSAH